MALTTYAGNGGTRTFPIDQATADGMFHTTGPQSKPSAGQAGVRLLEVTDGALNTLLFGERTVGDSGLDSYASPACPITPPADPPVQAFAAYLAR